MFVANFCEQRQNTRKGNHKDRSIQGHGVKSECFRLYIALLLKSRRTNDSSQQNSTTSKVNGGGITLSGLGNVILGIFNGQKHLPHRDSKVTQVLRECLGSLTCQATMLAHVSPDPAHYSETLHTVQLASRLHRMRRKRLKSSGGGSGSGSSDEHRRLSKMRSRSAGNPR